MQDFREKKRRGERITALTAYDYPTARLLDESGIDVILVGDSLVMVVLGYEDTTEVTLSEMVHHTRAAARGVKRALLVGDLPIHTYQDPAQAVFSARALVEAGAQAVKLEGGVSICPIIARIVDAGIPVLGHIGLQPQSIHIYGTYKARGTEPEEAERILADAKAVEAAGAFGVVVEKVPAELAKRISAALKIPTIGIGAGADCDGQILVTPDMLGMNTKFNPRFVRRYAKLSEEMDRAFQQYRKDVKSGGFPGEDESY